MACLRSLRLLQPILKFNSLLQVIIALLQYSMWSNWYHQLRTTSRDVIGCTKPMQLSNHIKPYGKVFLFRIEQTSGSQ